MCSSDLEKESEHDAEGADEDAKGQDMESELKESVVSEEAREAA